MRTSDDTTTNTGANTNISASNGDTCSQLLAPSNNTNRNNGASLCCRGPSRMRLRLIR